MGKAQLAHHLSATEKGTVGTLSLCPPYKTVVYRRAFRIVASTTSAARTLGDLLPVDMI